MIEKQLLSPAEAVAYLGGIVKEQTLAVWRCTHRQPLPYIKVGRRIAYRRSDLDVFLNENTVGALSKTE